MEVPDMFFDEVGVPHYSGYAASAIQGGKKDALQKEEHSCGECGKSFKYLSMLKEHQRRHTGEMPYKCTYPGCTFRGKWRSSLYNHRRYHDNDILAPVPTEKKRGRKVAKQFPTRADVNDQEVLCAVPVAAPAVVPSVDEHKPVGVPTFKAPEPEFEFEADDTWGVVPDFFPLENAGSADDNYFLF